ncbi:hypothetical protein GUJ93_ZPchr0008g12648 [Zizania palustris]|uniref:Uncharacterized protein n=1 Tax=Zizania palustris TaxID=103762 RepID=A0A8J5RKG7_ZIZPA|nr:hypothetical protein GUJ93_ZPchr0008g12648 [Zizania palustris]
MSGATTPSSHFSEWSWQLCVQRPGELRRPGWHGVEVFRRQMSGRCVGETCGRRGAEVLGRHGTDLHGRCGMEAPEASAVVLGGGDVGGAVAGAAVPGQGDV